MRLDYVFDAFRARSENRAEYLTMLKGLDALLPDELSVVGNASSIFRSSYGELIDARPTIRFNSAQIVSPSSQGSRWDFVATSNQSVLRYYRVHEPVFHHLIFTPHLNVHKRRLAAIGSKKPVLHVPIRLSRELSWRCLARPTTGMQILSLMDILNRVVHLFGFDWKTTPTFYDQERQKDPHNHSAERKLALSIVERRGWKLYD